MMKKMYNVIAATVCAAMCVCACSSGRDADGGKEPAKTQEVNNHRPESKEGKHTHTHTPPPSPPPPKTLGQSEEDG